MKPGGGGNAELEVVVLRLANDKLFSETERSEGVEVFAVEDIFKDAKVPSDRLFGLDINEGDVPSADTHGLKFLVFECSDISCAKLGPLPIAVPMF